MSDDSVDDTVLATFYGDDEFPVQWDDGQKELFWVHDDLHIPNVPDPDPENATFVLNRVDVQYSFPPLIPGSPFNLILIGSLYNAGTGQYTFYRHVEMRAM